MTDRDGTEEELEHKLVVGDVKTCIVSLGELYRNGWQVRNAGNDEMYPLTAHFNFPLCTSAALWPLKLEFFELGPWMKRTLISSVHW